MIFVIKTDVEHKDVTRRWHWDVTIKNNKQLVIWVYLLVLICCFYC